MLERIVPTMVYAERVVRSRHAGGGEGRVVVIVWVPPGPRVVATAPLDGGVADDPPSDVVVAPAAIPPMEVVAVLVFGLDVEPLHPATSAAVATAALTIERAERWTWQRIR